jgi:hypothetical protein
VGERRSESAKQAPNAFLEFRTADDDDDDASIVTQLGEHAPVGESTLL